MTRKDKQPETFWQMVRRVAANMNGKPDWMHAGITLNPEHYETYAPQSGLPERETP